jgi:phosphoribosyl 1,2-cyclic phosphodiesterase
MKLTFLGTRGYIKARSRRHRRHSSLQIAYYGTKIVIDCGEDWLGQVDNLRAKAIFITHAHPDHALGLQYGGPCPVYATEESWEEMEDFAIDERRLIKQREPVELDDIRLEPFPVVHSTKAPAVGYRVTAGRVAIFYVPDVVYIEDRAEALRGVKVYIGDGATISRSMVRKPGESLIGHTPIRTQLTWCKKEKVERAIFTHCGSELVTGDERTLGAKLRAMAAERQVKVEIAYDGMEVTLR